MPKVTGIELRKAVFEDELLSKKCIPYIFLTTGASTTVVQEAYAYSIQGIFQKSSTIEAWKDQLSSILQYWQEAKSPNLW